MEDSGVFSQVLLDVFRECFYGDSGTGAFLSEDSPGILSVLSDLDAAEASQKTAGEAIATHARHVAYCMDIFLVAVKSGISVYNMDWSGDWVALPVTENEWANLQLYIKKQTEQFEKIIGGIDSLSKESCHAALGALAHAAFHLGAISVKYDVIKSSAL